MIKGSVLNHFYALRAVSNLVYKPKLRYYIGTRMKLFETSGLMVALGCTGQGMLITKTNLCDVSCSHVRR